jgi:hypothetical protein
MRHRLIGFIALALACGSASAQLIRPDSATAGSEFSSLYDIGNAIDGSGLPADFTVADLHANYSTNNHWTTANGAIAAGNAFATFFFDDAQTLGAFHLWNHRSNVIASNSFYAVTQFDLVFKDAGGNTLGELLDVAAVGGLGTGAAQTFTFDAVSGVRSVLFRIDSNSTPAGHAGVNYTGVAEVAFGQAAPVPEPSTWAALGAGLTGLALVARRRRPGTRAA